METFAVYSSSRGKELFLMKSLQILTTVNANRERFFVDGQGSFSLKYIIIVKIFLLI